MKKCEKCGKNIENDARCCPACGAYFENSRKRQRSQLEHMDIQNNKIMAALAYMGLLVFIPLFAARESRFAKFHVKQGLILLFAEMGFSVSYCVLSFVVLSISWRLYFIVRIAGMVSYVFLVLAAIGISNAVSGRVKKLPVIGGIL